MTTAALHGHTCAILLFEEPGGEIESLSLLQGVLRVDGGEVMLTLDDGGDPVRIPPHLVGSIERVTDELRECLEDIASAYWLRAYYDGRLNRRSIDLTGVLARCAASPEE